MLLHRAPNAVQTSTVILAALSIATLALVLFYLLRAALLLLAYILAPSWCGLWCWISDRVWVWAHRARHCDTRRRLKVWTAINHLIERITPADY